MLQSSYFFHIINYEFLEILNEVKEFIAIALSFMQVIKGNPQKIHIEDSRGNKRNSRSQLEFLKPFIR